MHHGLNLWSRTTDLFFPGTRTGKTGILKTMQLKGNCLTNDSIKKSFANILSKQIIIYYHIMLLDAMFEFQLLLITDV